jgi:hypothetical protein
MLRERLDAVTGENDVSKHAALIDDLRRNFPHTISVLRSTVPLDSYTCLVHALGFAGKAEYKAIALYRPWTLKVFAGRDFAHWLVSCGALDPVTEKEARVGDLIMYYSAGDRFEHAGILRSSDRVESKWGIGGLYEHGTFEVPASYGDHVHFLRKPRYVAARRLFFQYAKENCVPVEQVVRRARTD